MCDGRRFQADGAATEKELLESWRLNCGTIKSRSPKINVRYLDVVINTAGDDLLCSVRETDGRHLIHVL